MENFSFRKSLSSKDMTDLNAGLHTSLYQRFKTLQAKLAKNQLEWGKFLPEWQSEAQQIRIDEPPTYWAVYTLAWNQTAERYRLFNHRHPIEWYQRLLRNVRHFRPDEFCARPDGFVMIRSRSLDGAQ
jgi:hypothetical protein